MDADHSNHGSPSPDVYEREEYRFLEDLAGYALKAMKNADDESELFDCASKLLSETSTFLENKYNEDRFAFDASKEVDLDEIYRQVSDEIYEETLDLGSKDRFLEINRIKKYIDDLQELR